MIVSSSESIDGHVLKTTFIPALYRSPITATNVMNDTVAELRARPYQMAHVRSAASQNGSTAVDDDARKSDYKRIISNNSVATSSSPGSTQTALVSDQFFMIDKPHPEFHGLEMAKSTS